MNAPIDLIATCDRLGIVHRGTPLPDTALHVEGPLDEAVTVGEAAWLQRRVDGRTADVYGVRV